ncbi:MAG: hypothetical protein FWF51_03045 [Chitinivibrionia bacterium]|nr:hypothetical protein [Chitinivibrionia bacterium]
MGMKIILSVIGSFAFYILAFCLIKWIIKESSNKSQKLRREKRIRELINKLSSPFAAWYSIGQQKLLQEELDILKKERENENVGVLNSANQYEKSILELKNEIENLKNELGTLKNEKSANEKSENEKLMEIISKQKSVISDLEMELKIKKSAHEKLVY